MIHSLNINEFLSLAKNIPVVDVRSPLEFDHAHIPGAFNLPIFSNEERAQVGTAHKQQGREKAILLGFDLTGAKWSGFIKTALEIAPDKKVALHCWRGGMRSGAMAWALNLYGFEVYLLVGGYKKFRNWALNKFTEPYNILILGGMTGSGKTLVLNELKENGQQVIDLEELADHQGSSYGSMGKEAQPSQEQFENLLATELEPIDHAKPLWLEDESLTIGKRLIPNGIWHQMREAQVIKMIVPTEERIAFLAGEYGKLDTDFLIESTERIGKRLGPVQTRDAVAAIKENRMTDFVRIVLVYYDKTYTTGQSKRVPASVHPVECKSADPVGNWKSILNYYQALQFSPIT